MPNRRPARIAIPKRLKKKLEANRELEGAVLSTLADFEPWLEDNKLVFFPEYTDHGPDHIRQVIETASSLIADDAWPLVTAEDAALIVLASLLHDCAMHLSEDGFIILVTKGQPAAFADDAPWPELWERFLGEASRFDGRKLMALFGDTDPVRKPPLDANAMTRRDRLLIGEFLRRHHPRLAHEIAMHGVPGPDDSRLELHVGGRFAALAGHVARSHGLSIRGAVDRLSRDDRRAALGAHPPFVMALLRIADYVQVQSERAPKKLLSVRSLRSPVSQGEWRLHDAIESIDTGHDDPEAIYIKALPRNANDFVKASKLFRSMQKELDETWALLGETYGRFAGLAALTLNVRRIRSSLDNLDEFATRVSYIPATVQFTTAGANLLKLLVGPLYGDRASFGVRELLQNALDAVRELRDFISCGHHVEAADLPKLDADVVINIHGGELSIHDRGIGMTAEIVTDFFLRVGASFRDSDAWRRQHTDKGGRSRILRSGRFGVGALAAFLIGDSVEVTTRHAGESDGVTFRASMNDDFIELRKISCPIGTLIRIPLRDEDVAQQIAEADWYCLDDPSVVMYVGTHRVPRQTSRPNLHERLSPKWRRLPTSDFPDVHWSYWVDGPRLVCNGIVVARDATESPLLDLDDRPQLNDPTLSVFDSDGRLPLTLQRTDLAGELPFSETLLDQIAADLAVFVALSAPRDPVEAFREPGHWLEHPAFAPRPRWANSERGHLASWLCCTPWGWSFASPSMWWHLSPQRIIVLDNVSAAPIGMNSLDFQSMAVLPVEFSEPADGEKSNRGWYAAAALIEDDGPNGIWTALALKGCRLLVPQSIAPQFLRYFARLGRPETSKLTNEWVLVVIGTAKRNLPLERIAAQRPPHSQTEIFGELITLRQPGSPRHPIADRWTRMFGRPAIPYSVAERTSILKRPELASYVEARVSGRAPSP